MQPIHSVPARIALQLVHPLWEMACYCLCSCLAFFFPGFPWIFSHLSQCHVTGAWTIITVISLGGSWPAITLDPLFLSIMSFFLLCFLFHCLYSSCWVTIFLSVGSAGILIFIYSEDRKVKKGLRGALTFPYPAGWVWGTVEGKNSFCLWTITIRDRLHAPME